jgi:DNA-binding response OmpR family regulator
MCAHIATMLSGYDIEMVTDAAAALVSARDREPDLVLSELAAMADFELLRALRADARTRDVPVVLMSEPSSQHKRIEGLAAGANDYLVTPFSARELLRRVQTSLELARPIRQRKANRSSTSSSKTRRYPSIRSGAMA